MPDPPTDPNEEITLSEHAQEEIDKKRQHAILIERIKRDLKTNPRYKEFYEEYHPWSIEHFIDEFSWRKARYIEQGKNFMESEEHYMLMFEREGAEHLREILQKRFFNFECLWRAEKIRIPEVEHTYDFVYWSHHLEECPFLSPITEDEVELYVEYVLGDRFEEYPGTNWERLKRAMESDSGNDDDDDGYPEWFTIYDMRFGTGELIKLPDIRGEKEDFYLDICFAEERKAYAEKRKSEPPPEGRPRIGYHDLEVLEKFIRRFEDTKLLRYFHIVENFDGRYADDEVDQAVDMLRWADETIPIEAANDWKDGIIKAADRYRRQKLAGGVRSAYKEYLMRLNSKVTLHEEENDDTWDVLRKKHKEDIVKGRVMNGEQPDLNF